ncbi:hypothetical protein [Streptomyces sp. KM273126]|uniref:hypothetical protein n=1 Tax=Streptomyces sp. KM273126 TaxID=2545247 RepID=UPI0026C0018F
MAAAQAAAEADHDTWQRDVKAVIGQIRPYIQQHTQDTEGKKRAVVLDTDNTTLETDFHPWYRPAGHHREPHRVEPQDRRLPRLRSLRARSP